MRLLLLCLITLLWSCGSDDDRSGGADAATSDATTTDAAVDVASDVTDKLPACEPPAQTDCTPSSEAPLPLNEHAAGWDPIHREMVVFGGNTAVPVNCGFPAWVYQDATWVYRNYESECGAWSKLEVTGPSARGRHAYASTADALWIFGGRYRAPGASTGPYTVHADLWRYDFATRRWSVVEPEGETPTGRYNASLTADAEGNLWLYGGNTSTSGTSATVLDELWRFNIETQAWSPVTPQGEGPGNRIWHASGFDGQRGRVLIYGGADETAFSVRAYFADLWAYDIGANEWNELGATSAPEGRFWANLLVDPSEDRYIVFGGHDATELGNRNDTWAYNPSEEAWSKLVVGDTYNEPANGACDFPTDFVNVDLSAPERRNAATLVWADECDHAILFGGKTDCGAVVDVWRWRGRWEAVFSSGQGEVCLRASDSPESCASLCF